MGELLNNFINMSGNLIELIGALDNALYNWFIFSMLYAFLFVNTMGFWEVTRDFANSLFNSYLIWTVVAFFVMLVRLDSGVNLLAFDKFLFFFVPCCLVLAYKIATDK